MGFRLDFERLPRPAHSNECSMLAASYNIHCACPKGGEIILMLCMPPPAAATY